MALLSVALRAICNLKSSSRYSKLEQLSEFGTYFNGCCRHHMGTFDDLKYVRSFATKPNEFDKSKKLTFTTVSPVKDDLCGFHNEINELLGSSDTELNNICQYYFDGQGKHFRPAVVFLMSRLCNFHLTRNSRVLENQRKIAIISEMIHVGSLLHDDVVDASDFRRGKQTVNYLLGNKNAVLVGNFIVSTASVLLATIDDHKVTSTMSEIISDIVKGEFMQESQSDHFDHYLTKTYKKTASLVANCCKAVAILSGNSEDIVNAAFDYGTNLGIAFQLIDDILDFVSSTELLGKPAVADLKLGLATAPILFAREKHPHLDKLILRRFKEPGDVADALHAVLDSNSIEDAKLLAKSYCDKSTENLKAFASCDEKQILLDLPLFVFNRTS